MTKGTLVNVLCGALATLALVGIASGQDFVNGGFETGDLTGWTSQGDVNLAPVLTTLWCGAPASTTNPVAGTYFGYQEDLDGYIYQTVAVDAGTHLTANFSWKDTYPGETAITLYNTAQPPTINDDFANGYADGAVYKRGRAWTNHTDWWNAEVDLTSEGYVTLVANPTGGPGVIGTMTLDECSLTVQPAPAAPQPRVTTVEVITNTASTFVENNNCQMTPRVVRAAGDVFALVIDDAAAPADEQLWQLVKRNGGRWDVVASGMQGYAWGGLWVSPDETLHVLAYPKDLYPDNRCRFTMWTGQWDNQTESITMTPQEVPDAPPPGHFCPRLIVGGDTSGHLAVSSTYDYAYGHVVHYYAIYDADTQTWTSTNSVERDSMYTYNWFFPHEDGDGVTYIAERSGFYWEYGYDTPPDHPDWDSKWGITPPHYGSCFNQQLLYGTDDLATTVPQVIRTETIEPTYPGEFVFNFSQEVYQDHLDRIFVISARVGGGWGTADPYAPPEEERFHFWMQVLSPDGTVLDDVQLPDPVNRYDWDTVDGYRMFQDATGQFWLLCGQNGGTLTPAGDDGLTFGEPIELDFGYDQLWWNVAIGNSRSGMGLSNTIDLTFAGLPYPYNWPGYNLSEEYLYAQIEIPEIGPGDCDRDGDVDNVDFGAMYGAFTGPGGTGGMYWSDGDFDLDGDVDNVDFGTLYGNYTGPLAGGMDLQVTPEPATLALLIMGSIGILKRTNR